MAYATTTRGATNGLSVRLATLMDGLRVAMQRRRVYAKTLRELSSLSDRDLTDLGLSRTGITALAREAAYGI